MRQIFTSPRLENVQTVEALLRDGGIETRVTDGRSWNRATSRDFSYSDRAGGGYKWPALWVVQADDFSRARQLLRDHGVLLESTRPETGSFLPTPRVTETATPRRSGVSRIRAILFVIALIGAIATAVRLFGNF